jgi:uncharacterized protein YdhG (YjbR/CyaY superfamily)
VIEGLAKGVWTRDRRGLTYPCRPSDSGGMSQEEVDAYLDALDEPKRSTLRELRQIIVAFVPDAEQCISYGMPAFRLHGKVIADSQHSRDTSVTYPTVDRCFPNSARKLARM